MSLSLSKVTSSPSLVTYNLQLPSGKKAILRPLESTDVEQLTKFLEGLSQETRRLSTFPSFDISAAKEMCEAINRYDKLRFVLELPSKEIIGLFEFSFDIPETDIKRFSDRGITINSETDCRFGPTLADDYQNQGIGSLIFPHIANIAKKFGKKRIILWGAVLADNTRAIKFYEKHGFKNMGIFTNKDGLKALDMLLQI